MNWTLEQLKAFIYAVEEGSFSAAARRLGKAHSRVSTAISNLEIEMGINLFDRRGHTPVLTTEGQQILHHAKIIYEQCELMQARAVSLSTHKKRSITLALDEALPPYNIPEFLFDVTKDYPHINIQLTSGSRKEICSMVDGNEIDIGILLKHNSLPSSISFEPLGKFGYVLVVSKHHPLAKSTEPLTVDLQKYRQIILCDLHGKQKERPISPTYWSCDDYFKATLLIEREIGWGFLPYFITQIPRFKNELVVLDSKNIPIPTNMDVGLVFRRDHSYSEFLGLLKKSLAHCF